MAPVCNRGHFFLLNSDIVIEIDVIMYVFFEFLPGAFRQLVNELGFEVAEKIFHHDIVPTISPS